MSWESYLSTMRDFRLPISARCATLGVRAWGFILWPGSRCLHSLRAIANPYKGLGPVPAWEADVTETEATEVGFL